MEEDTLRQSIERLITKVPAPVRSFILNDLPTASESLMNRHKLHIDQGGVLEAELLLMLLGQSTPKEFVSALADAGIDEETVRGISADVNTEIFAKIQAKERQQGEKVAAPAVRSASTTSPQSVAAAIPAVPPPTNADNLRRQYEPRTAPPPPNLPGQVLPPPAPRPTPPPPPRIEVPTPPPAPPAPPQPQEPASDESTRIIHTMARDMQALKSGEDPFRVAHPAPPAWAAVPSAPAAPPVPSQPLPPAPTPPQAPEPVRETPPAHTEPLRTHLKQYGVDPYREPVE